MNGDRTGFKVAEVLSRLRKECGDSDFGYRMQGFFAHVLIALGSSILEVNAQGHPDVKARLNDRVMLVQVKASKHGSSATMFELAEADLRGISTMSGGEGMLALLDCAAPARWIIVPLRRARGLVGRAVHIATLQAEADSILSDECTEVFAEMILRCESRLANLTYRILRRRALSGRDL